MSVPNYRLFASKWAYFAFLGDLSSALSLTKGIFRTFRFLSIFVGFFRWSRVTHLTWPNIGKEHSLAFFIEFERHTLQRGLSQNLEIHFIQKWTFENCCHLCPKSGLNPSVQYTNNLTAGLKLLRVTFCKVETGVIHHGSTMAVRKKLKLFK